MKQVIAGTKYRLALGTTAVICALAAGLTLCGVSTEAFSGLPFNPHWCGHDASQDWVCRYRGTVYQAGTEIPFGHAILATKEAPISTASLSKARLTFRNQAICTLEESSEIYPRYGAPSSLYSQEWGASSCTSPRGRRIRLFCGRLEKCPAEVRTRGTALFKVYDTGGARVSLSEELHREARIVSCHGFIRVILVNGAKAEGGSNGRNRFVVVIRQDRRLVSEEGREEAEESTRVVVSGRIPGRGDCRDSFVREQEGAAQS